MRLSLFLSLSSALLAAQIAVAQPQAPAPEAATGRATKTLGTAQRFMAAAANPLAATAGREILRAGGSAADAAIAANAVQCLLEPTGCGVGGDLFALVWEPGAKKLHGLNASGRSPAGLTLDEFQKRGLKRVPSLGPLPVSVPGCVDGWCELSARFGKLPLARVLEPAVRYAREGAPVSELVAYYWARSVPLLSKFESFAAQMTIDGRAPTKGEIWRNANLANLLERIGREGRAAFYAGETARRIEEYMRAQGGFLTAADLLAHRSDWVEPVSVNYRGYDVWEIPPPGQGLAALQILNVLEGFDLKAWGFGSVEYVHAFVEAKKLAFEDRARFYADPQFARVPVRSLLSDEYAAAQRARIGERAAKTVEPGNPALEEGDTICLSTADSGGMMVSLIQSNYRGMGSGMTPTGLGFVLHDRGELFDLEPGRANSYAPAKRPFHTIIPGFVTKDGEAILSFGVMGGATQPQGHAQIVVNLVDFGMNTQEAGDAPRILHDGSSEPTGERMTDGGKVSLEEGYGWETVRALLQKGHAVSWNLGEYGGYQAIRRDPRTGVYFGASESRKDGQASGY